MKTKRIWTEKQLLLKIAHLEDGAQLDQKALNEAYEAAQAHGVEILKLRARVTRLEDAIRKAIDFGDGHAWWDSEGNAKIESCGYKLLKETLEATS